MSTKTSPWFEAWYVKGAVLVAGAGLLYVGQIRYERAVKADERRRNEERIESAGPPRFKPFAQVDFAGKSLPERRRGLEQVVPGMHYVGLAEDLANVRALVCVELPDVLEESPAGVKTIGPQPPDGWSFVVRTTSGEQVNLYPIPTPTASFVCLRLPYSTTQGFDHPVLNVLHAGKLVDSEPLRPIAALPTRTLGSVSLPSRVEVRLVNSEVPSQANRAPMLVAIVLPTLSPRYRVRLTPPPPEGESVFVKLIQTDCEVDHDPEDWTELKNGEAMLSSPCGVLAKEAQIEVVEGVPSRIERTVTANLGTVDVRFGQPTFIARPPRTIKLTPTTSLILPPQGNVLRRPPHRAKRAMLVSAFTKRDWSVAPSKIPDLVTRIDWVSPSMSEMGLDALWLSWGSVKGTVPATGSLFEGPLNPTLRVGLITWKVTRRFRAVVPIGAGDNSP